MFYAHYIRGTRYFNSYNSIIISVTDRKLSYQTIRLTPVRKGEIEGLEVEGLRKKDIKREKNSWTQTAV